MVLGELGAYILDPRFGALGGGGRVDPHHIPFFNPL